MRRSLKKWRGTVLVLALSIVATLTTRADLIIDTFNTTAQFTILDGITIPFNSALTAVGEAIGGERDISLTRVSADGIVTATAKPLQGVATYGSDPGTTGNALFSWDGVDGAAAVNPTGLYSGGTGVDLTQGGANTGIGGRAASDNGANLVFTVYTDATHASQAVVPVVGTGSSFTYAGFFVSFLSFSPLFGPGTGAIFSNVGAITMYIDGSSAGVDVGVDFLRSTTDAVPEPAAYVFLLFGCGLLISGRFLPKMVAWVRGWRSSHLSGTA